jgi:hypothetical protein
MSFRSLCLLIVWILVNAQPLPSEWQEKLKKSPLDQNLQACYALSLIKFHLLDEAMPIILSHLKKYPDDFIAWEYVGGVFGGAARKLMQKGKEDAFATLLNQSVQAFSRGYSSRVQYFKMHPIDSKFDNNYPQLAYLSPLSLVLRGWGDALMWLGRDEEARNVYQRGIQHKIWANSLCRPEVQLPTYNLSHLSKGHNYIYPITLFPHLLSIVENLHVFALEVQSPVLSLQSERKGESLAISGELDSLWIHESAGLHSQESWMQLPLFVDGKVQAACNLTFRQSCSLLTTIPALHLKRGQAKFSIMFPGTVVRPHAGPVNSRLRLHCGIMIPQRMQKSPYIKVGTETAVWEEGECFVFDESCQHEVVYPNEQVDGVRVVLIIDFCNPLLESEYDYMNCLADGIDKDNAVREYHTIRKGLETPTYDEL